MQTIHLENTNQQSGPSLQNDYYSIGTLGVKVLTSNIQTQVLDDDSYLHPHPMPHKSDATSAIENQESMTRHNSKDIISSLMPKRLNTNTL